MPFVFYHHTVCVLYHAPILFCFFVSSLCFFFFFNHNCRKMCFCCCIFFISNLGIVVAQRMACTAGAVPDLDRVRWDAGVRGSFHGGVEVPRAQVGGPVLSGFVVLGRHVRHRALHCGLSRLHQHHRHQSYPAVGELYILRI